MKLHYINLYFFRFSLISLVFMSSCITSSNIKYLQADKGAKSTYKIELVEYHVQSGDNLYIKLSSMEPVAQQLISQETGSQNSQTTSQKYKDIYLVDKDGFIKLPQLNKIQVNGLTLQTIKDSVDYHIQKFYTQATADVRMADNYITILGDVNNPGRYLIDFRDKISIFELIGMAGDLSYEAKRSELKIIRKKGELTEIYTIDLTKRNVLENEHYYLLPNDLVYVEPLKAVSWNQRFFPFTTTLTLLLSTTTTLIVLISYFK